MIDRGYLTKRAENATTDHAISSIYLVATTYLPRFVVTRWMTTKKDLDHESNWMGLILRINTIRNQSLLPVSIRRDHSPHILQLACIQNRHYCTVVLHRIRSKLYMTDLSPT